MGAIAAGIAMCGAANQNYQVNYGLICLSVLG